MSSSLKAISSPLVLEPKNIAGAAGRRVYRAPENSSIYLQSLSEASADLQVVMGYRYPRSEDKGAIELHPVSGRKSRAAAQAAGLAPSSIPTLLVEGDNRAGLGQAIAKAIGDAGINLSFVRRRSWAGDTRRCSALRTRPTQARLRPLSRRPQHPAGNNRACGAIGARPADLFHGRSNDHNVQRTSVDRKCASRPGAARPKDGIYASRSIVMAGGAVARGCRVLADRMRKITAHLFRCSIDEVSVREGKLWGPRASVDFAEAARVWYLNPEELPPDADVGGLEATVGYRPEQDSGAFSYSTHAAPRAPTARISPR